MTILQSLKKLHKKMTGQETTSKTIGGVLDSMQENYTSGGTGGGGSLPTPGTAGNVLTSTGTAWESAAPSGGSLRCTFTISESVTCDKSIAEIATALSSGIDVYGDADGSILIPSGYNSTHVLFQVFSRDGADILVYEINGWVTDGADVWTLVNNTVNGLPSASAYDNGKILGVSDGAYALVSPSSLSNAPLIVHGTISGSTFSFTDTTVKDVYDAKVANRAVFLDDGDGYRWNLTGALLDDNTSVYSISFGCLKHGVTKIIAAIIGIGGTAETTTDGSVIESDLTPNT